MRVSSSGLIYRWNYFSSYKEKTMKDFGQFITDHPIFIFGMFILATVLADGIASALINLSRRKP